MKRTSAKDKCLNFPVNWYGLGRKDTNSLLGCQSGRKVLVGAVPKMSSAQMVLGSSHSLHTGLLKKGLMRSHDSKIISFLYVQGGHVQFMQATLPPQPDIGVFGIFWRKKPPIYLLVNTGESSCFPHPVQQVHI